MKIQEERVLLLMEENGITQRKMAQTEKRGYRSISIFKDGVVL